MGNICSCLGSQPGPVKEGAVLPVVEDPVEQALVSARDELVISQARDFLKHYWLGKLIGHGAYASVCTCTKVSTGEQFAVKILRKDGDTVKQREGVVKEVAIMRMLQKHPNAIHLEELFESPDTYYIVMEMCSGGELFDQVIAKGHFSEREAANLMRKLLDFVAYAHSRNIIHRDLKPENILLTNKTSEAQLKVVDFGTSDFCKDGQWLSQKFGTPYYVAPEVLQKHYCKSADVWSCGVILYILLSGFPPFGGKSDSRILQRVQMGSYSFANSQWEGVSEIAKNLITCMLTVEPDERGCAVDLLEHQWFTSPVSTPSTHLGAHMLQHLRNFAGMCRMKRLALVVLARTLTDRDVQRLRDLFLAMDEDEDGRVSAADLHQALSQVGAAIEEQQMHALMAASDLDGDGLVEYEAFIAAMIDSNKVAKRRGALRRSFEQLDRDGDGFITVEDLAQVLQEGTDPTLKGPAGRKRSMDMAALMVHEVDADRDSRVSFAEFRAMWQQGQ